MGCGGLFEWLKCPHAGKKLGFLSSLPGMCRILKDHLIWFRQIEQSFISQKTQIRRTGFYQAHVSIFIHFQQTSNSPWFFSSSNVRSVECVVWKLTMLRTEDSKLEVYHSVILIPPDGLLGSSGESTEVSRSKGNSPEDPWHPYFRAGVHEQVLERCTTVYMYII